MVKSKNHRLKAMIRQTKVKSRKCSPNQQTIPSRIRPLTLRKLRVLSQLPHLVQLNHTRVNFSPSCGSFGQVWVHFLIKVLYWLYYLLVIYRFSITIYIAWLYISFFRVFVCSGQCFYLYKWIRVVAVLSGE